MSFLPTGLTEDQRTTLESDGLVRLPAAIPRADAATMADRLWAYLEAKHGIRRGDPESWKIERPAKLSRLTSGGAFRETASEGVKAALDDLLGAWAPPKNWGPPLVAFPSRVTRVWSPPHNTWHLDSPAEPGRRGLSRLGRVFAILAPLPPGGGGTVVALGTHRLAEAEADRARRTLSSAEVRERLSRLAWIRDLCTPGEPEARRRRFMDETTVVDGVPLRVAQMTGEPGDVWLMHPNCLHAGSTNVRDTPRMVVTQWVLAKDA